jgi:hypothetical protein
MLPLETFTQARIVGEMAQREALSHGLLAPTLINGVDHSFAVLALECLPDYPPTTNTRADVGSFTLRLRLYGK